MKAPLFSLCICLFLAGCAAEHGVEPSGQTHPSSSATTSGSTSTPGPGVTQGPGGRVETLDFPLRVAAAVGNRTASPGSGVQFNESLGNGAEGRFIVGAGATGILVEARTNCTTPMCRFYGELAAKVGSQLVLQDRSPTFEGKLRRNYEPSAGVLESQWVLTLRPDGLDADMKGEARVSVFYGTPIPASFTAFS